MSHDKGPLLHPQCRLSRYKCFLAKPPEGWRHIQDLLDRVNQINQRQSRSSLQDQSRFQSEVLVEFIMLKILLFYLCYINNKITWNNNCLCTNNFLKAKRRQKNRIIGLCYGRDVSRFVVNLMSCFRNSWERSWRFRRCWRWQELRRYDQSYSRCRIDQSSLRQLASHRLNS